MCGQWLLGEGEAAQRWLWALWAQLGALDLPLQQLWEHAHFVTNNTSGSAWPSELRDWPALLQWAAQAVGAALMVCDDRLMRAVRQAEGVVQCCAEALWTLLLSAWGEAADVAATLWRNPVLLLLVVVVPTVCVFGYQVANAGYLGRRICIYWTAFRIIGAYQLTKL